MNLACVICAEIFVPLNDVFVTSCGHMFHHSCLSQWLERAKSCPQCRSKCSEKNIHKIYFNLADLDTSRVDVGSLQQQLENANLQTKIAEKDLKKAQDEIKNLKEVQKKCMKTISGLEQKLEANKFVISSYSEQIKMLKVEHKVIENLKKEVNSVKQEKEQMQDIQNIITSTASEVEKLLKDTKDAKTLSVCVVALKRELRLCENKKIDMRNLLKVVQHNFRKEQNLKKLVEDKVSHLESEIFQLTEKVKLLEQQKMLPCNESKSVSFSENFNKIRNISMVADSPNASFPGILEITKKIEQSNSPYLNIKSSSVGLTPLLKHGDKKAAKRNNEDDQLDNCGALKKVNSNITEKFSILKKPRLQIFQTNTRSDLAFNGLGGSEKKENFGRKSPNDYDKFVVDLKKPQLTLSNRVKSGKLRKNP